MPSSHENALIIQELKCHMFVVPTRNFYTLRSHYCVIHCYICLLSCNGLVYVKYIKCYISLQNIENTENRRWAHFFGQHMPNSVKGNLLTHLT